MNFFRSNLMISLSLISTNRQFNLGWKDDVVLSRAVCWWFVIHISKRSIGISGQVWLLSRTQNTFHLKIKKLSTNSPIDFNSVLDTINHYWIDPAKYFCHNTSSLSAIYDSFKSKILRIVESKNGHHFYYIIFL